MKSKKDECDQVDLLGLCRFRVCPEMINYEILYLVILCKEYLLIINNIFMLINNILIMENNSCRFVFNNI